MRAPLHNDQLVIELDQAPEKLVMQAFLAAGWTYSALRDYQAIPPATGQGTACTVTIAHKLFAPDSREARMFLDDLRIEVTP